MSNPLESQAASTGWRSDYQIGLDDGRTEQATKITELQDDLQFVERWAVHHGTKPHVTPADALSMIQHCPAITAITKSYADGKVPDTFNPFARITELEAQLADAKQAARWESDLASQAIADLAPYRKDAERYQFWRSHNVNQGNELDQIIDAAIQAEGKL